MRDRTGKSARIVEKIKKKIGINLDVKTEVITEENITEISEEKSKKDSSKEVKKSEITKTDKKKENLDQKK